MAIVIFVATLAPNLSEMLNLECNTIFFDHGFAPTRKSGPLTSNLHQSGPRSLFFILFLLTVFSIRCNRKICITDIAVYRFWIRSVVMRVSVVSMLWLEKLVDTGFAEDMAAWDSDHSFCAIR